MEKPQHYLDYFHGALYLSPGGTYLLDDGWVWHPVGLPVWLSLDRWLSDDVWESEVGASRIAVCARNYYWNRGMAWLNERTVVLAGIGEDETEMTDGVRIFDVSSVGRPGAHSRADWSWAKEAAAFVGPAGRLFSDGQNLCSAAEGNLFRWDLNTGRQTGHVGGFCPTHQHLGARELAELRDFDLLRWKLDDPC